METEEKIIWDKEAQTKFHQILEQIPPLIRDIAEIRITKKVENILREQKRLVVSEKDMIDAFFAETPPGFIPPMKMEMDNLGIDYTKYGYAK